MDPKEFVARWEKSGGAELANSQTFLNELCDVLGVPHPDPTQTDAAANRYVFEKAVEFNNGDGTVSKGRVDLFRAGCFVLESKQGSERKAEALATITKTAQKLAGTASRDTAAWDRAMQAARRQAQRYAAAIPDEWPPFLVVVDVGYCFDLYADFTGTGKNYVPFPDPRSFRIPLDGLCDQDTRGQLKLLWTDPHALDPSKHAAEVTGDIAARLAKLAKSLEAEQDPEVVAGFLMRCLFTMFAEDVELIRKGGFTELLLSLRFELDNFAPMVEGLWTAMDEGTFSQFLREKVRHFNGKFFKDKTALPLTKDQLELLIEAAQHDWGQVEPAIFGTLLERALDPVERHKLGAHYTPRAYVERLVMPTIIEPLRERWDATYAAAIQLDEDGNRKDAIKLLRDFHGTLCETRVLDPACGSGNFLYVSMELMKRLEGEVVSAMASIGDNVLPGITIDPHQFLGIEINPRAAALAELVLWIGFIQWHRKTRNEIAPPEPILRDYKNIECRDAVMTWDSIEPVVDDKTHGPITRWDGRTTKPHPVTGKEVPDENARVRELRYVNPQKAEWPEVDYIVGNPPYLGARVIRHHLGDTYVDALRSCYKDVPETIDFVMYWWDRCAELLATSTLQRFGLVTTNSITQSYSRPILTNHLVERETTKIAVAITDHPWPDLAESAAVEVVLTVGCKFCDIVEPKIGKVLNPGTARETVVFESAERIDVRLKAGVGEAVKLNSNKGMCFQGVVPAGDGFKLNTIEAENLGVDIVNEIDCVKPYIIGRDLTQKAEQRYIIDLFGLSEAETQSTYPRLFQWIYDRVYPHRKQNKRKSYRDNWWIFAEPRPAMRVALKALPRFIGTPYTAKFRTFVFVDQPTLPDAMVYAIASSDALHLAVLSSRMHTVFATLQGGRLEDRPRYNSNDTFFPFPFPVTDGDVAQRLRNLGERLDAHRKRQQEQHPNLTMTGMYNVLAKLQSGEVLTSKEQTIHQQGLVSVLKQIHDDLDAAVFDAYGWPQELADEEILQRLVDLNQERADEESRGIIRWLRPDFQNPDSTTQTSFTGSDEKAKPVKTVAAKIKKQPWPKKLPDRMVAIQTALQRHAAPADVKQVAAYYTRAKTNDVGELLETLVAVGNVRQLEDGRFISQ